MTENDGAWRKVFDRLEVGATLAQTGLCYVTAEDLKLHGQREPRLMAKIDTLQERPEVFREHEANILPIKNGVYALIRDPGNRSYFKFGNAFDQVPLQRHYSVRPLKRFQTFSAEKQFSESQAIDAAFVAGLLTRFFGDDNAVLTLRGRLFSAPFTFEAPSGALIEVNRVQIEVDAGYEGDASIFLIEAKVGRREDFNIRQLYYPYMNWSGKTTRKVVPVFLTYTNGQYYLTEFEFSRVFGELKIVRNEGFTIDDPPYARLNWKRLLAETLPEAEEIPFPQADDMDKVVDLTRIVGNGLSDKTEFADFFEFDERQGDYYANASKYLGLLKRDGHGFQVTEAGRALTRLTSRAERTEFIAKRMLSRPTFRKILELLLHRNFHLASLTQGEVGRIIAFEANLNETTANRRATTARNWTSWLLKNSQPA
jgi:hypothetical protein